MRRKKNQITYWYFKLLQRSARQVPSIFHETYVLRMDHSKEADFSSLLFLIKHCNKCCRWSKAEHFFLFKNVAHSQWAEYLIMQHLFQSNLLHLLPQNSIISDASSMMLSVKPQTRSTGVTHQQKAFSNVAITEELKHLKLVYWNK